jgi:uncharacterized protein
MQLNDFFAWNMKHMAASPDLEPMTDDDCDKLFLLFMEAGLPETAMTAEMADGYLTACVVGPESPPVHQWMEVIFGQPTLPVCADAVQQEQLLTLLLRRHRDISEAMRMGFTGIMMDALFMPQKAEVPPQDRISPYELGKDGYRKGDWDCKEWAYGFRCAIVENPQWNRLINDPANAKMLGPLMLYLLGYNRDDPEMQIEEQEDLLAQLVISVYALYEFWHPSRPGKPGRRPKTLSAPFANQTQKIGRNDPCPCGSGKKYKKCCGA